MTNATAKTSAPLRLDGPLVLVGAGKMGTAMLSGWLAAGLSASDLLVVEPSASAELRALSLSAGFPVSPGPVQVLRAPSVLVMAVKPQAMDAVFPPVAALAGPGTITLSIAAGKSLASFEHHLPPAAAVVRAMPNTPAAIGRGMTVLTANSHTSPVQKALCASLMSAVGAVGWVDDENLMDAVTAVSGSGPAYVFLLAEALTAAGISAGLDPGLATRLARETLAGSAELLRVSPLGAADLRRNVTSPGGTTAAALAVLMAPDGLSALIERAVAAAVARSRDLSK